MWLRPLLVSHNTHKYEYIIYIGRLVMNVALELFGIFLFYESSKLFFFFIIIFINTVCKV